MKVLHVVPSLSPLRGGPSFAVPAMAQGLARAGLEVHIATTDDDGPERHLDIPLGRPLIHDGVTCWYFRRQTRFYTASWPLTRWLAQQVGAYDLVHIHALFSYASLPAAWFAAKRQVPYIVRPIGVLHTWGTQQRRARLKRLSFQMIERHMLRHAAAVHFTSKQEEAEAALPGVHMQSVVLPLGIELAPFGGSRGTGAFRQQHPMLSQKVVLLFLSRLDRKKGLDMLLQAFAQVRQACPDAALVLAGSGEPAYEAWLREQAQALGIAQDVMFTGFLSGEQKRAALADCDIFVLPSYSENFGVVIVEAMASGLPVVVSDQVGIAEEVAQAPAGLVVPCSAHRLADALRLLIHNHDMRQKLGAHGRMLAQQRFSLATTTTALTKLYVDLV